MPVAFMSALRPATSCGNHIPCAHAEVVPRATTQSAVKSIFFINPKIHWPKKKKPAVKAGSE